MSSGIKLESLRKLGVYELRELARNVGVPSPTTKNRQVLENEIVKYSQSESDITAIRKGRPPKTVKTQSVDNSFDVFLPRKFSDIIILPNKKDGAEKEPLIFQNDSQSKEFSSCEIIGFVRKTGNNYFYLRSETDDSVVAVISPKFIEEYHLQIGDRVKALIVSYNGDVYYKVQSILLINNEAIDLNRKLLPLSDVSVSDNIIEGLGIVEGSRLLCVGKSVRSLYEEVAKLYGSLQNDYHIVIFAPCVSVYQSLILKKDYQGDFIYTLTEEHPAVIFETFDNVKNYLDVLSRQGERVLLFVFDLLALKHSIKEYLAILSNELSFKEEVESTRLCMKLLSQAKVLESGASITVVATCTKDEQEEYFYKTNMRKAVDNIFYI